MDLSHLDKEIDCIIEKSKKYMCLDDAKGLFYLTMAKINLLNLSEEKQHESVKIEDMTREKAFKWVSSMENSDGTKGEHWSLETTNRLRIREGLTDIPEYEFFAIINMLYSDYGEVANKYNLEGNVDFWLDLAKAWYFDKDANKEKTMLYKKYIVKKE